MAQLAKRPCAVTIVIVGALDLPVNDDTARRHDQFFAGVANLLREVFPEFVPGRPPVTVMWSDLPEAPHEHA